MRALNALRRLRNQGRLQGWPLDKETAPEPKDKTQKKHQQAIVLEPPMLAYLAEKIGQLQRVCDPAFVGVVWGAGCLKYHSTPRKITMSSFHAFCCQGKQAQNQDGFYCTPRL